nr:MAG TPA: hypothetical protein [Caudoviricetes sp.]
MYFKSGSTLIKLNSALPYFSYNLNTLLHTLLTKKLHLVFSKTSQLFVNIQ